MAANQTNGNYVYTVGSTEPFLGQIFKKDGITPEPIPNITDLQMNLRNKLDGTIKTISDPKITVDDENQGKIKHSFSVDEFSNVDAVYYYQYSFTDDAGEKLKVPAKSDRYVLTVERNHES